MHATVFPSRQEKVISGAFAFGMHLVFLALLVFGMTWQKSVEPQANIVDLWASLPSPAPPKVELPPRQPELKLEVKPPEPPSVKPVAKPEVVKPDIAIKEKAEKERRALEEKQKDVKKQQAAVQAALKQQQEGEEAEAQRRAVEQEDAQRRLAAQQALAQAKLRNEYIERIRAKIRSKVVDLPNIQGNPEAEFDVVLIPGGEVLSAKLKRSSGNAAYDRAVERAIFSAQPLPLPPDPAMFREFRELNLKFRPQE